MHPTVMGMIAMERASSLEKAARAKRSATKAPRRSRKVWQSPRAARIAHA